MRWVWFAGLTMVSLLIFDAGLHQLQRSTAHFSMHPAREDIHRDTLVVYFPGILTDGESSSVDVLPVWRQTGDVMLVSYEGDAFDGEAIIRQTVDKIARTAPQYKHIIFIGASMGGLLAYSTMVESRTLLSAIKYRLILIDAPTGWKDLQPGLQVPAPLAWLWWAGPLGAISRASSTTVRPTSNRSQRTSNRVSINMPSMNTSRATCRTQCRGEWMKIVSSCVTRRSHEDHSMEFVLISCVPRATLTLFGRPSSRAGFARCRWMTTICMTWIRHMSDFGSARRCGRSCSASSSQQSRKDWSATGPERNLRAFSLLFLHNVLANFHCGRS